MRWDVLIGDAFDPERKAILLVAGDKSGAGEKRFYSELIRKADFRFDAHLKRLKAHKEKARAQKHQ